VLGSGSTEGCWWVQQGGLCVRERAVRDEGNERLTFFLVGGVVAMPAKGDVAATVVSQLTLPCTTLR